MDEAAQTSAPPDVMGNNMHDLLRDQENRGKRHPRPHPNLNAAFRQALVTAIEPPKHDAEITDRPNIAVSSCPTAARNVWVIISFD